MATNKRSMSMPCGAVWDALADGSCYADWVVGTRLIRDVDANFPAIGSALHFTVGHWPLRHQGHTEVTDVAPGERLELLIHAWPAARVRVQLDLSPSAEGGCDVIMTERPIHGPVASLHNPLSDFGIYLRNIETLRRLEAVAANHHVQRS